MAWPAGAPPPQVTTDLRSCRQTTLHFHCAFEIRQSQSLAHMLDSLVRVSRRAARDDAKAEPIREYRFALAVAQSFAQQSHCTRDQAGRGHTGRTFHGAPAHIRRWHRPDTAHWITTGNKTGQRSPDLSMPNKGRRAADRPTKTRTDTVSDADARPAAADERLFVRRHASHVRLIP